MSAYEKLNEHVRAIVDRNAELLAERDGIDVDEARELLSLRVTTRTNVMTHGTGH